MNLIFSSLVRKPKNLKELHNLSFHLKHLIPQLTPFAELIWGAKLPMKKRTEITLNEIDFISNVCFSSSKSQNKNDVATRLLARMNTSRYFVKTFIWGNCLTHFASTKYANLTHKRQRQQSGQGQALKVTPPPSLSLSPPIQSSPHFSLRRLF